MNRFPRPAPLAPPVNPPPPRRPESSFSAAAASPGAGPSAARGAGPAVRPLSGLRSPAPGIRLREPGLKDVAAGWVAQHPAAGLGAAAAAGAMLGWLLKRR